MTSQRRRWRAAAVFVTLLVGTGVAAAQGPGTPAHAQAGVSVGGQASSPRSEEAPRWQSLKPAQRESLAPLERNWSGMDAPSKQKWLAVVARFPAMAPAERARIQGQMADWSKLSPSERGQARLRFQEAKQLPASDRRQRWQDYQALPAEQKQQFAARAQRAASAAESRTGPASTAYARVGRGDGSQAKANVVPNPALSAPLKSIAPTVVQARPGATTTLLTKQAQPPAHQQTGMPKIAATPEFIDRSTLLPRRGAQAAGVGAVASEPSTNPH